MLITMAYLESEQDAQGLATHEDQQPFLCRDLPLFRAFSLRSINQSITLSRGASYPLLHLGADGCEGLLEVLHRLEEAAELLVDRVLRERREQAAVHLLRLQRYAVVLHRESAEERTFTAKKSKRRRYRTRSGNSEDLQTERTKKRHA